MNTPIPALCRTQHKKVHGVYTVNLKLIGLLTFLFILGLFSGFQLFKPPQAVIPAQIGSITVHTDCLPAEYAGYSDIHRRVRLIIIHETDNFSPGADAQAHNTYLHSSKQADTALSWHYTVDDKEIYHHLPDEIAAYHASDGMRAKGGNESGIGIEICVNQDGDYQKAVDNAAQLVAYLLQNYKLDLDDVKQHYDFCGKDCPHRLRENDNWQNFLAQVEKYLAS